MIYPHIGSLHALFTHLLYWLIQYYIMYHKGLSNMQKYIWSKYISKKYSSYWFENRKTTKKQRCYMYISFAIVARRENWINLNSCPLQLFNLGHCSNSFITIKSLFVTLTMSKSEKRIKIKRQQKLLTTKELSNYHSFQLDSKIIQSLSVDFKEKLVRLKSGRYYHIWHIVFHSAGFFLFAKLFTTIRSSFWDNIHKEKLKQTPHNSRENYLS